MKVAVVCGHADGRDFQVGELAAALTARGHRVTVHTVPASAGDPLAQIGRFAGCLDDCWRADRPDVAHADSWTAGVAAQLAARPHQVPVVQTFGGLDGAGPGVRARLERIVARRAAWVVATCTGQMFQLARLGRSRAQMTVVPYGVDPDVFTPVGPAAGRGPGSRIVAVGRTFSRKGFDTVINALPAIPDAEFLIVGGPDRSRLDDDPEVRRLRALAGRAGVSARVRFTGAVPRHQMPALLRSADVLTCTPRYEPFGIVSLEAMACGVPVVASAVGGMADTVVHDVTGRLVDLQRPGECAGAVSAILRDPFLRRSLGLAGRDRARARFSWDQVAQDTLRVYGRLVPEPFRAGRDDDGGRRDD